MSVGRVRLRFADFTIEFVDRVRGIKQVVEWVEGVITQPIVVYGPEGCGKSAWLKQVAEVLRGYGFDVIYVDVLNREYVAYTDVKEVFRRFSEVIADVTGLAPIKLADLIIVLANELLRRWGRRRVALLVDEVFQAIGLDRVEVYVKSLLNIIEYPPAEYEKVIAIVVSSEGLSRTRIGRHRWAEIRVMWNMGKEGFKELYEEVPGIKPDFEDIWRLCGGNPKLLAQLYRFRWSVDHLVKNMVISRNLHIFTTSLTNDEKRWLYEAIEDPDTLLQRDRIPLLNKLVELNMIVNGITYRDPELWIDEPPPEKDLELGIGKYIAWQTPLHREAIKKALSE
jgi:dephospho-CoA kinase